MAANPYEPPQLPSDAPPPRPQRPKYAYGYVIAVLMGGLFGGIAIDGTSLWRYRTLGMVAGAVALVVLYHVLPQYERHPDD